LKYKEWKEMKWITSNMNKTMVEIAEKEGMLSYIWNYTDFLSDLPENMIKLIINEVGEE